MINMRKLPNIPVGVPVKVVLGTDAHVDNTYLIALNVVDYNVTNTLAFKTRYHIFTARELADATDRYYKNMDIVIFDGEDHLLGHTYPITYNNVNGIMTTRWFCRFDAKNVEDLDEGIYCALFSACEVRRSIDRVSMYYTTSFFSNLMRGLKSWMTRLAK